MVSGSAGSSGHLRLASPIGLVPSGSPATTPYTTPLSGTGAFPDASPRGPSEDGSVQPRSRDLSVEQQLSRSASPSGRRGESPLPPLPQSPSDFALSQARQRGDTAGGASPGGQGQSSLSNSPSSSPQRGGTAIGLGVGPVGAGLNVPTSKAEKRRSINPGMSFNMDSSNSTYAAEPKLSPLPPSPLRASFTEAPRGSLDSRRPPPSPAAPGDSFPFRSGGDNPPPRKSSLDPSQLTNGPLGPRARGPSIGPPSSETAGQRTGGTLPLNVKSKEGPSGSTSTPKIGAPALPTMSFSLSDDFASMLGGIDGSGNSGAGIAGLSINDKPLHAEPDGDDSPPVSPLPDGVPNSMTRSPMVGSLSSIPGSSIGGIHRNVSPSSSRDRLEPGPTAPLLRSRQASAESTYSLSGRLGSDSSFGQIVGIVAEAKHKGKDKVEVDLGVLSGIIGEIEELKDALSGLKSKYTGVKVRAATAQVIAFYSYGVYRELMSSELLSSIRMASPSPAKSTTANSPCDVISNWRTPAYERRCTVKRRD